MLVAHVLAVLTWSLILNLLLLNGQRFADLPDFVRGDPLIVTSTQVLRDLHLDAFDLRLDGTLVSVLVRVIPSRIALLSEKEFVLIW